jgi:hypothetical protein
MRVIKVIAHDKNEDELITVWVQISRIIKRQQEKLCGSEPETAKNRSAFVDSNKDLSLGFF